MLKAVIRDGFLQFLCSFLTHLTRTAVPSTATASPSGFLHQNLLAPYRSILRRAKAAPLKLQGIYKIKDKLFWLKTVGFPTVFFILCGFLDALGLSAVPSTATKTRSRLLHQNLLAPERHILNWYRQMKLEIYDNLTATDNIELMITPQ